MYLLLYVFLTCDIEYLEKTNLYLNLLLSIDYCSLDSKLETCGNDPIPILNYYYALP